MLIFSWFSIAEKFESKQREYSKMHITKMKQMDKNELLSMTDHWARQIQSVAFDATKQILMIQISSVLEFSLCDFAFRGFTSRARTTKIKR